MAQLALALPIDAYALVTWPPFFLGASLALVGLVSLLCALVVGRSRLQHDLSDLQKAQDALRQSEERFRLMVEEVRDYAIFMLDLDGRVVSWNAGAERIKGYRAADILGKHFSVFYLPEDIKNEAPQRFLQRAARDGRAEIEGWRLRQDGTKFWAYVILTALHDKHGALRGFVKITRDATQRREADQAIQASLHLLQNSYGELEREVQRRTAQLRDEIARREKAEEALQAQAITDTLTGLYNRRGFLTLAEQHLKLAQRQGKGFLLFMADLDRLKPINDTYGHAEGDFAIAQAAKILRSTFRSSDILARIGGDEFCVVVIEDEKDDVEELRARLRRQLEDYNRYSGRHYKLGLSVGSVRVTPDTTSDIADLMRRADRRLYGEKERRKTPIKFTVLRWD